ncbi:hypothetical protein SH611_04835 [Geminicoccaceae bacterium 1502E]|nr:hypothetical protein [Geminicoccaceae bacterium 1502E]
MLGLSLSKILLVVMVIVLVWRGKRLLTMLRDKMVEAERHRTPQKPPEPERQRRPAGPDATTLVECPRCGLYVPNGTICRSKEECRYRDHTPAA